MRSESTRFLGQPRLTKAKVGLFMNVPDKRSHWPSLAVSRNRGIEMRNGFNQQQRDRFPMIDHVRIVADEGKENEAISCDTDHLRMTNVKSPAAVHADTKRPEWLRLHIGEKVL